MKKPDYTSAFNRDVKKAEKKHRDISELKKVVRLLIEEQPIPRKHNDHQLSGDKAGLRELHISWKPDWLLLYEYSPDGKEVIFLRCGSHDEIL